MTQASAVKTEPIIDIQNLAVSVRGKEVVSDASFYVRRNEVVALVGESGSGKSMVCRAAVGLLGPIGGRVARGSIAFGGDSIHDGAPQKVWRGIRGHQVGYVPQASLAGLDPIMKIGGQLRETIKRLDPESNPKRRSIELLDAVRINRPEHVAGCYPHQLSGGMRQRVMIALALAGRPKLMIADEATTALDATVQRSVLDLLRDIQSETHMSLLMVTHDLSLVREMADRVYVMYAGQTVETGTVESVLHDPRHPYTEALLGADPSLAAAGALPQGIAGAPPPPEAWADGCRFADRCSYAVDECRAGPPVVQVWNDEQLRTSRCIRDLGAVR